MDTCSRSRIFLFARHFAVAVRMWCNHRHAVARIATGGCGEQLAHTRHSSHCRARRRCEQGRQRRSLVAALRCRARLRQVNIDAVRARSQRRRARRVRHHAARVREPTVADRRCANAGRTRRSMARHRPAGWLGGARREHDRMSHRARLSVERTRTKRRKSRLFGAT